MKMIKRPLVPSIILLFIFFISIHTDAGAAASVQKISESALDELIHTRNNKMALTFMAACVDPVSMSCPS